MMWKLLLVSLAAARALPSSITSVDSLEPTLRALDQLEEDAQSVDGLLAVATKGSAGGVGHKVGPSAAAPRPTFPPEQPPAVASR